MCQRSNLRLGDWNDDRNRKLNGPESKVGARSEIKALVRVFSNYIPDFEIQIPDPEHERIVLNGNFEPTVMGRPTQKLD